MALSTVCGHMAKVTTCRSKLPGITCSAQRKRSIGYTRCNNSLPTTIQPCPKMIVESFCCWGVSCDLFLGWITAAQKAKMIKGTQREMREAVLQTGNPPTLPQWTPNAITDQWWKYSQNDSFASPLSPPKKLHRQWQFSQWKMASALAESSLCSSLVPLHSPK